MLVNQASVAALFFTTLRNSQNNAEEGAENIEFNVEGMIEYFGANLNPWAVKNAIAKIKARFEQVSI